MKLGLIGIGRMGRMVRQVAEERGHHIVLTHGREGGIPELERRLAEEERPDVVIEFTRAPAVFGHVKAAMGAGVPIVVGTTGWTDRFPEVEALVETSSGALLYGENFSIGGTLFRRLVEAAGTIFDTFPGYDPFVLEHHHRGKVDAPSGTAEALGRTLLRTVGRKTRMQVGNPDGAIAEEALHVTSVRAGHACGSHQVGFDGEHDIIQLTHTARSRTGFAQGAVWAAEWIQGRTGFFRFSEVLLEQIGGPDA